MKAFIKRGGKSVGIYADSGFYLGNSSIRSRLLKMPWKTQPFIRYEVTDRVILHNEPCACGNPSPWIEPEGRNDDVITFTENGKEVRVPPLAVYATLKEVNCLKRFQLVVRAENRIELRLEEANEISKEDAFAQADSALRAFFQQYGIHDVDITLSPDSPRRHPGIGKFKHIINEGE